MYITEENKRKNDELSKRLKKKIRRTSIKNKTKWCDYKYIFYL